MGLAPALFEEISYDESGNISGGSFMDYLVPHRDGDAELGDRQDDHALPAPSAGSQGKSASPPPWAPRPRSSTPWSTPLSHLGVKHIEIPMTPEKVWNILKEKGVAE